MLLGPGKVKMNKFDSCSSAGFFSNWNWYNVRKSCRKYKV